MGLDVVLGPARDFLEWTSEQWDTYYETADDEDGDKVGSYTSVACTVETVGLNLENGEIGSRFPMFMRIAQLEGGWYWTDLDALVSEIRAVRSGLEALPLERMVLAFEGEESHHPSPVELDEIREDFRRAHPDHALNSLADFNHHLLDTLQRLAEQAQTAHKGLVLC
jgi:hypothetical protein